MLEEFKRALYVVFEWALQTNNYPTEFLILLELAHFGELQALSGLIPHILLLLSIQAKVFYLVCFFIRISCAVTYLERDSFP